MSIKSIVFNGIEKTGAVVKQHSDENLELLHYFQIEQTSRGDENRHKIDFTKNQVIEFEFEDGTHWITSPDLMSDIFPELLTAEKRSVDEPFELPAAINTGSADRSLVGKILLKALKIFSKKAVDFGVKKLAVELEDRQLQGKTGLFGVDSALQLIPAVTDNTGKPYLLLIHGTASSVYGSFGEAKDTDLMNFIRDAYHDRVLAFQHRTLSENPFQNVKDLVEALPVNCVLHLITTSRGGLVGEILSRFCNSQGVKGFNSTEMAILKNGYPTSYFDEVERLINEIRKITENKKIIIEKFIRIACPAGGTTLASKRLDFFMNITLNLIGLGAGIAASPVYLAFRNLISALIESKNKPGVLPGLEAQNPGSPFIKALNCTTDLTNPDGRVVIDNSLVVIAGNTRPALKINALWIIASKLFFMRKNDLVVDTETMTMGTRRSGVVLRFFYEDNQINHFKYFENRTTSNAILLALKSEWGISLPGFTKEALSVSVAAERNINIRPDGGQVSRAEVSGSKPIVLLLPGIMGSNLEFGNDLLWIDYFRIITGGLSSLKITNKLKAASLVSTAYKRLVNELEDKYDVVTFPFDWRLSLEDSAALLNKKVKELMKFGQPLKIIGHSMGGVLVRDFMVLHSDTWNELNESEGFRLIFLGAPLQGSFRIPAVLFGMDRLIDKLSLIDLVHTKQELLKIFSGFRGLLGLLPFNGEHDFSDITTWEKMREGAENTNWPLPSETDLQWFSQYRDKMKDALKPENLNNAVYIAGRDKATPCNFRMEEIGRYKELVFLSTGEGDQSVTWESGIPKPLIEKNRVYYVNVTHGELACNPAMFKGIKEILADGKTNLFTDKKPSVRGDEMLFKSPEFRDFDLSQAGINLSVLGIGGSDEPRMEQPPISVSISQGDLFYAKHPILAGHFEEDGILNAEKEINKNLDNALTYRHRLGTYPGPVGTSEIFLTGRQGFRGAIIIGLGTPENLTASELTKSVEQGVSKYLLYLNENPYLVQQIIKKEENLLGLSSLIIGSGYGGLSVENSVKAIIQGIYNANAKVKNLNLKNSKTIDCLEFVELFEDAAVSALYSLVRIESQETRSFKIVLEEKKLHTLLGAKKRIPAEISSDWWNRITVKKDDKSDAGKNVRYLTFNASTSRAHEKETELLTTPALMEGMIRDLSTSNRWTTENAKTIFELLIPNDFKEQLKKHGNIIWILDHYTAEYPWELLQDEVEDSRPLCVTSGMIRQLATKNYRQLIRQSPKINALIIADPDLKGFASQLPGALKEGQTVAEVLTLHNINTTTCFKSDSSEIIAKMFCNDYRIIHLSGHGIFNQDQEKGSGMVIGKDMFLSTREIKQMSYVPELVFVNCCHIGKISGMAEELYHERYKLAANIGTQLIENGVRCVIAAGWAVDDSAALDFANVFYDRMFNGYTFGEAVKEARKSVFEKFGSTNTWGAYQCYGDPFYRFKHIVGDSKKKKNSYLIAQEAEVELENLLNELKIGKKPTIEYVKILECISEKIDQSKIRTPEITEKEGLIYFELREYAKSCEKFSLLLNTGDATYSFSVAEKYYNARAKKIVQEFNEILSAGNTLPEIVEQKREESLSVINEVTDDLKTLVKIVPSSERYNILGSTFKRKAILSVKNKEKAYTEAAWSYQKAYFHSKNWYSLTNWLALESTFVLSEIHSWGSDLDHKKNHIDYQLPSFAEAADMLAEIRNSICTDSARMSYWDMLAEINISLCNYIVRFSEQSSINEVENIRKEISGLWQIAGSMGNRFAEIEHLEFIIDALSVVKNKQTLALATALEQLKKDLAGQLEN